MILLNVRGRLLDWAWGHPRWKRRLREIWGITREAARRVGLPAPFDPLELSELRRLADSAAPMPRDAPRVLFVSWRGWSTHLATETVLA
ncbi:MAG: hypothetical protein ACRDNK_19550, partial [Solirubrobacteraceae bacterium]